MDTRETQKMYQKEIDARPKITSLTLFILIVVIWTPHTLPFFKNAASMQAFLAIILIPLPIIGLFLSYNAGLSLIKLSREQIAENKSFTPSLMLLFIHIGCIVLCILHELVLTGYPIKLCFDSCEPINIFTVILAYSIVSTILFLPAYFVVFHKKTPKTS